MCILFFCSVWDFNFTFQNFKSFFESCALYLPHLLDAIEMFAAQQYNSFETSLDNAKAVVGFEFLYESLRKNLNKLIVLVLVYAVGLPIVFLFGYWLLTKRKKFQKHMKNDFLTLNTSKDYLDLKESLSKLDELMPALKKVSTYNLKKAPYLIRFTLCQMQKMTSTLVTYNDWLKSRLNSYNEEQYSSKSQIFKLVPEEELWKERNKVYQYWM